MMPGGRPACAQVRAAGHEAPEDGSPWHIVLPRKNQPGPSLLPQVFLNTHYGKVPLSSGPVREPAILLLAKYYSLRP